MAKITELTALTTPANSDVIPIVDDPSGSPATKKITVANLTKTVYSNTITANTLIISGNSTPSNTATATAGTLLWDSDYIYVATANNSWKRVALSNY